MLKEYLNETFPGPFSDEFLKTYFKNLGVDVSISGDKFLFKYDQIAADWYNPLTKYCRGSIFRYTYGIGWEYLSRPWQKFFNRHEGFSGYSKDSDFSKVPEGSYLLEKLDGSCCQIYFVDGFWKCSTLGSIDTAQVGDFSFTFSELFWRLFGTDTSMLVPGNTYLFELCSVYNQIVTAYEKDHVVFLGAFSNDSGKALKEHSEEISKEWIKPKKIPFNFNSWKDLEEFVEAESKNQIYGKNPEGFVAYIDGYPAFKLKNSKYLELHGVFTGDRMFVRKNLVNLFFKGNLDDVENDLPDVSKKFVEHLKEKYRDVWKEVCSAKEFLEPFKSDRKEYALKLREVTKSSKVLPMFQGYFFECLKADLEFSSWLVQKKLKYNFEAQMDFWKSFELTEEESKNAKKIADDCLKLRQELSEKCGKSYVEQYYPLS